MTDTKRATRRKSLAEYLDLEYPLNVIADPEGGYVVMYPDLPGCITQIETLDELPEMAEDARRGWLTAAYSQDDIEIPLPSYPEEHSGKFNLRLPRSLHRQLAEMAEREGMSLNTYVAGMLGRGDAQTRIERRLEELAARVEDRLTDIENQLDDIRESLRYRPTGVPKTSSKRERFQFVEDGYEASVAA